MNFSDIKKILVIKLRHIGDVLLAVPVFRALRENFSDAQIAALVNSGTDEVLTGNPLIDEIIVFDRAIKNLLPIKRYLKEIKFLREIRAKGFDMTVDLTGGDRAAIVSFLSGARYRLAVNPGNEGFIGKRYLYTHLADIDKQRHMVLQNLDIVRQFGITTDNTGVDFFIPEEAKLRVKRIFEEHNIKDNDIVIHVHPTSRWLFKCWKDEYMADVIGWLIDRGMKVVVTSASDKREMDKAKRILSLVSELQTPNSELINLCGKTTIKELAVISEAADLFLGVDSAPMHIAAALGTPVIALFGPTGEDWIPYGKDHIVISKEMPCKPCKKGMCEGIQLRECLIAIKPEDVKEAVLKILNLKN
ncbi:MAG: putative lipopolysaccharide heptosyltransferase III [Thermodesulfovibrionia bacterium]|nr:putative lipopolysaccharide heptosyltransferase III [Thermodesulfovibrionia bacterium]